ncbi:hypothetical protein FHS29_005787 [Saccharothrix tamanrassetensis]|uniref:Uncharacterized protein n=1 Tax=Saccharothrix tamanrassetensis TaxID=1051531 RepID=A0A841CSZ3_9PSEU|nr:hypothetical protein [Saccharothrix tamanrassetensis]MBB5959167.1 hypothetical protein [Saccharothrix tamanrassetensis]
MYESMTVQVRAGLGEWRLVEAVQVLSGRYGVLRDAVAAVRRVAKPDLAAVTSQVIADAPGLAAAFQAVWLDADDEGRLVLLARQEVLAELPWHVLLPELVAAWKAHAPILIPVQSR